LPRKLKKGQPVIAHVAVAIAVGLLKGHAAPAAEPPKTVTVEQREPQAPKPPPRQRAEPFAWVLIHRSAARSIGRMPPPIFRNPVLDDIVLSSMLASTPAPRRTLSNDRARS
jgi:hypothetical protein